MRMCSATLEMQPTERDKEASISKMVNTMSLGCYRETEHDRKVFSEELIAMLRSGTSTRKAPRNIKTYSSKGYI